MTPFCVHWTRWLGVENRCVVPFNSFSRSDLEHLSVALLQNEMPVPKPVRLLGVSLSALQHVYDAESQLALPM
jgi:DNA polymerase IV